MFSSVGFPQLKASEKRKQADFFHKGNPSQSRLK